MIWCVWSFMKRRRTKDYVKLLETLIKEARKIGLTLKPIQVMIDFEIAAKKAFKKSIFCLALLLITSVEQEFELLSIQITQVVSRKYFRSTISIRRFFGK